MFRRVANAVAAAEKNYGASEAEVEAMAERFFRLMSTTRFLPNTPTFMNAGRQNGMLSACFVLPVPDDLTGIFESVKHTALIQKAGGGTGCAFDTLRPTGDLVASSGGRTSGPISFMRVFCETTQAIQQGAFRRGANMAMMAIEHPDILKFILVKSETGEFQNWPMHLTPVATLGPGSWASPHTTACGWGSQGHRAFPEFQLLGEDRRLLHESPRRPAE
jgi:ribonucleoside-diphosphate reductase alpha chain